MKPVSGFTGGLGQPGEGHGGVIVLNAIGKPPTIVVLKVTKKER